MTDLDALLHAHADRWQARQPPPAPLAPPTAVARRSAAAMAGAAAAVAMLALVLGLIASRPLTPVASADPIVRARLLTIVHRLADGPDDSVSSAQAVQLLPVGKGAPLGGAKQASLGAGKKPMDVWMIELRGRIACLDCGVVYPTRSPDGLRYVVTVDARTYRVLSVRHTDTSDDLARFGRVITLIH